MGILLRLKEVGPLDDADMVDFDERDHDRWGRCYTFRITGSRRGFGDALSAVKMVFKHHQEREFDPETKEWLVPATERSREKLETIFGNAANVFTTWESQLTMWDADEFEGDQL